MSTNQNKIKSNKKCEFLFLNVKLRMLFICEKLILIKKNIENKNKNNKNKNTKNIKKKHQQKKEGKKE